MMKKSNFWINYLMFYFSLHAFKLIEYCMEMQLENITKRQNHYSSSFANISSTQSQHHHTQLSGATATTTTPDSMMMLGAIFSESFTPLTRDRLLTACLSLLTQNSAQLFFPCLKRTVLCLATLPLLPCEFKLSFVKNGP